MQIKDSAPYHRSVSFGPNETLDSRQVQDYLLREGHSPIEAERIASEVFTLLEEMSFEQRHSAAA